MTSQKKNKLAALLEGNETPKNGPRLPFNALHSRVSGSKTKYHLLSSSKKYKTPLATLPNSTVKLPKLVSLNAKIYTF